MLSLSAMAPLSDPIRNPRPNSAPASLSSGARDQEMSRGIYRHFVESIKNGSFGAGAKIPSERELALQFSTSRTTVRKAIQVLEDDRLIERRLGSGTFVRQSLTTAARTSSADAPDVSPLDVLETRLALEPGISDLVVARATNEDFDRIDAAIDHMRATALKDDDRDFKEAGYLVQLEIVRASRNPLLIKIYEMLIEARTQAGWDTLRQLTDHPDLRSVHLSNAAAQLAALRGRDAKAAQQIVRNQNIKMIQQIIGQSWSALQGEASSKPETSLESP